MNRSKTILIILSILAVGLLITFWYLFNSSQNQQQQINLNTNTTVPVQETQNQEQNQEQIQETNFEETNQNTTTYTPQLSDEEKAKAQLNRFVSAFVERYGSYSNQSDYENLEDLLQFMTTNFKKERQQFIRDMRYENKDNSVYYGVTTKVLKTEIEEFNESLGRATYIVSTQKNEMYGVSVNAKIFYQSAKVELRKIGSVWQVNNLIWQ